MDQKFLVKQIFYGNEKTIQQGKRTLDDIDSNVKEKVIRCLK